MKESLFFSFFATTAVGQRPLNKQNKPSLPSLLFLTVFGARARSLSLSSNFLCLFCLSFIFLSVNSLRLTEEKIVIGLVIGPCCQTEPAVFPALAFGTFFFRFRSPDAPLNQSVCRAVRPNRFRRLKRRSQVECSAVALASVISFTRRREVPALPPRPLPGLTEQ